MSSLDLSQHYRALGLNDGAGLDDVKRAFRKLAFAFHPDLQTGTPQKTETFKALSASYRALLENLQAEQQAPFNFNLQMFLHHVIFKRRPSYPHFRPQNGSDIRLERPLQLSKGQHQTITYDRDEPCKACLGFGCNPHLPWEGCKTCEETGVAKSAGALPFNRPCGRCDGLGYFQPPPCHACKGRGLCSQRVSLQVDLSLLEKNQVQLPHCGSSGRLGGKRGSLVIDFTTDNLIDSMRSGDDLLVTVGVKLSQLLLGDELEVQLPTERLRIKIPQGHAPHTRLRLTKRGYHNPKSRHRGDLIVTLEIKMPQMLSHETKRLIRNICQQNPSF